VPKPCPSGNRENRPKACYGSDAMREVVVRDTQPISPTVRGLTLACTDGAPLDYVPGQWVNLELEVGGKRDKRAYSIASAPNRTEPNTFEIAVTRVDDGFVSRALHALPAGSLLAMDGPHGFFTREGQASQAAWFVGTGTGVCPLRAMLQSELAAGDGPPLGLLFGVRHEGEILYRAEFERLAAQHARFQFHVTLSRPSPAWTGKTGYVQTHLRELIDLSAKPHLYVCGLSRMVGGVRKVLKEELGLDRRLIHSERYD
jgi:CDP-4-dehydro-6-deoxyglucose reductase, E3